MDFTTRLALNKPDGDPVTGDDLDVAKLNENFDAIDAVISFTVCTSTARPTVPFAGQGILETDTGAMYVWGGSGWLPVLSVLPQFNRVGIGLPASAFVQRLLHTWGAGGGSTSQVLLRTSGTAIGHRALSVMGGPDTQDRWWVDFDGSMQWSSGTAGGDISLKRSAAGVLDISTGTLTVGGSHPAVPGNFAKYPTPGTFTWTKPAKARRVRVRIVGGGGSGAGSQAPAAGLHSKGGGGGGAAYAEHWFDAIDLTATVSVTVGAGGNGPSAANGTNGGTTYFGPTGTPYLSASGGLGGVMGGSSSATWGNSGGAGGSTFAGGPNVTVAGNAGGCGFGGAGLGCGGAGGGSFLGGGGVGGQVQSGNQTTGGGNAAGFGGGGGGSASAGGATSSAGTGGDGGGGLVIIESYY